MHIAKITFFLQFFTKLFCIDLSHLCERKPQDSLSRKLLTTPYLYRSLLCTFNFVLKHDQMVLLRNYLNFVICNQFKCMTSMAKRRIKTVLVDLSGTIHIEDEEISGSKDALKIYVFC